MARTHGAQGRAGEGGIRRGLPPERDVDAVGAMPHHWTAAHAFLPAAAGLGPSPGFAIDAAGGGE